MCAVTAAVVQPLRVAAVETKKAVEALKPRFTLADEEKALVRDILEHVEVQLHRLNARLGEKQP